VCAITPHINNKIRITKKRKIKKIDDHYQFDSFKMKNLYANCLLSGIDRTGK
jgi:hypothetical protein